MFYNKDDLKLKKEMINENINVNIYDTINSRL